uniref:Uncharacterized protein n=1 Tax=Cucumis sativus TaxID=3659 RepID=A0A0A0LB93_CUCSA
MDVVVATQVTSTPSDRLPPFVFCDLFIPANGVTCVRSPAKYVLEGEIVGGATVQHLPSPQLAFSELPPMRTSTFLHSANFLFPIRGFICSTSKKPILFVAPCKFKPIFFNFQPKSDRLVVFCYRDSDKSVGYEQSMGVEDSNVTLVEENVERNQWNVELATPSVGFQLLPKLSLSNKAFLILTFIALTRQEEVTKKLLIKEKLFPVQNPDVLENNCSKIQAPSQDNRADSQSSHLQHFEYSSFSRPISKTSVAFTSLVIAAVPTLNAMRRAAISLSKLADAAREELPGTMAAIRLSGMEISDLTLELSDLSQEIADGVNKSAQAVQAAEAGIRQIGALAHQQTMSMIQERASLPIISLQPVVAGAAKKTSRAVGKATRTIMKMISGGESMENDDDNSLDRLEV